MEQTKPKIIGIIQPPRAGPSQIPVLDACGAPLHPYTIIYDRPPYMKRFK